MSNHLKGLLITAVAIIVLSPDALVIRLIEADQSTIMFWRGLFLFEGMLLVTAIQYRRDTPAAFGAIGLPGLAVASCWALNSLFFVSALLHTSVAKTLIIVSTAPVFAALLSRIFLREGIASYTAVTIIVVMGAVGLIVSDSYQNGTWLGDLFALGTALSLASTFVFTRKNKYRDMKPAVALSGAMVALVALPTASPLAIDSQTALLFLLLGAILTVSVSLLIVGPRYIPATEVSLMLPLETVLGSLIVWFALGERPTATALLGGVIVVLALMIHALIALNKEKKSRNPLLSP